MLQMQVYSERTANIKDIITRVGEDAFPYVNQAGMFVADGMGGGAGIPIIYFPEDCFDEEKLPERFSQLLPNGDESIWNDFSEYILQNFSSLTDPVVCRLYENPMSNTLRLKKSGYVGSHVLGTILTAHLLTLAAGQEAEEPLFADAQEWEACICGIRDSLFDQYQDAIQMLGCKYATTSINKINYYGTTLSAAFFRENKDSVDVIFLNCGDSRSYVWDADGFRQAAEDQGRDGGMSSCFSLREDIPCPQISFEKKTYQKPCTIFCMSDGIYNSFAGRKGFHSSPMYMEYFLMRRFGDASSSEEAEQKLKAAFDVGGRIDDSNSMTVAAFGYSSYEEFKTAAIARSEYLSTAYSLEEMPNDFFLEDYQKKAQLLESETASAILPLLQEAFTLPSIQKYCFAKLSSAPFKSRYCGEMGRIQDEIGRFTQENTALFERLCKIAIENYTDFVEPPANDFDGSGLSRLISDGIAGIVPSPWDKAKSCKDAWNRDYSSRAASISRILQSLSDASDSIRSDSEAIHYEASQMWTSDQEQNSIEWTRQTEARIRDLSSSLYQLLRDVSSCSRNLSDDQRQWETANAKAAGSQTDNVNQVSPAALVNDWIASVSCIEDAVCDTSIPAVRLQIIELVKCYQTNQTKIDQLHQELSRARLQAAQDFWTEHAANDIGAILKEESYFEENSDLKLRITESLEQNEEMVKCRQIGDRQKEIFDQYLEAHLSEVSEDKRSDVEKNGWM